jgi:biotin transport system substrate-specific component
VTTSIAIPAVRPVLADALLTRTRLRDAALVTGSAALVGIAAQLVVPIPGTPVPVSAQTLAVLLVGTALGTGRALAALTLYLGLGAAGLPWFAGGTAGIGGSSFGYVIGFVLAAGLAGALARRGGDRTVPRTVGVMLLGNAVIYAAGVPWLMAAANVDFTHALALGVVPFLIGDGIKIMLATGLLPTAWKLIDRKFDGTPRA